MTEDRRLEQLRSDFVATVSHELRTPLAAVYGAALTLRDRDLPAAQATQLLDLVIEQADRLRLLLEDILLTNRLEAGIEVVQRSPPFDAVHLAESVATAAGLDPGTQLVVAADCAELAIAANSERTRQVLVNLVDNAVKYGGGVAAVTIRIAADPGRVALAVSDTGPGIPEREQRRVFEKFYRLDPDMRAGVGGTGLGSRARGTNGRHPGAAFQRGCRRDVRRAPAALQRRRRRAPHDLNRASEKACTHQGVQGDSHGNRYSPGSDSSRPRSQGARPRCASAPTTFSARSPPSSDQWRLPRWRWC